MIKISGRKSNKIKKNLEKKGVNIRIKIIGGFAMLALLIIISRLAYLQFVRGDYYKQKAYSQQTKNESINPSRGTIYDSNGEVLAQSISVDSVYLNPGKVVYSYGAEVPNNIVAEGLAEIFNLDYTETLNKVSSDKSVVTIAKKVENDKVKELKEWMGEVGITAGINIDEDTKRYYPYGDLASNLLGFCGDDNTGLYGLEQRMDSVLTGTKGKIVTIKSLNGQAISDENEQYIPAENGNNIYLTIDVNIQAIAEKYLEQAVKENGCEDGGNIIIMNPQNGDILAMATYPDYNLNDPFVIENTGYTGEEWAELDSVQRSEAYSTLYQNRAVTGSYEPGSTFKVLMSAIGLEENVVATDTDSDFLCTGAYQVADRSIACWASNPHGPLTLRGALCNSCNPAFMQLGQRIVAQIGLERLYDYYDAFGLFDKVGTSFARAYSGSFHNINTMGPVELATTSFGENFTISPLQLIAAIGSIANDGVYVEPRIVRQVENPDTNSIEQTEVVEKTQVVSKETATKVKNMMLSVVTDGTGRHAKVEGYSIGGKSGTSEPSDGNEEEGYVASFIGISPIENTQVVVLVVLYKPTGDSHQGGQTAGPVVAQIMSEILPHLGVAANTQEIEESDNSTVVAVPNLKDKTVAEARNILSNLGFTAEVDSVVDENTTIVVDQTPKSGVAIEHGSTVYLYVNNETEKTTTTVPNIKGMTVDEATAKLKEYNLNINVSGSTGIVVSQDPTYDTVVKEGSVVNVVIKEELKGGQ